MRLMGFLPARSFLRGHGRPPRGGAAAAAEDLRAGAADARLAAASGSPGGCGSSVENA